MTEKASPSRLEAETPSRRWPSWLTPQNVLATCAAIGVIVALFTGFNSLWSRFDALSDRISTTGADIRKDIGERLDEQTRAINENTKGLAVLEERGSGIEEDIGRLEITLNEDVSRLEEKIDSLSGIKKTSY